MDEKKAPRCEMEVQAAVEAAKIGGAFGGATETTTKGPRSLCKNQTLKTSFEVTLCGIGADPDKDGSEKADDARRAHWCVRVSGHCDLALTDALSNSDDLGVIDAAGNVIENESAQTMVLMALRIPIVRCRSARVAGDAPPHATI
jgi:hypothetical protein